MKIVYVSGDHGIPLFGPKGGAVHMREMIRAFATLGHDVEVLAARVGDIEADFPAVVRKVTTTRPMATPAGDERGDKEQHYCAIGRALGAELQTLQQRQPIDLIYERHSLWSSAGGDAARGASVRCVLEVNAPLVEEQSTYRKLANTATACEIERRNFVSAHVLATVSDEVHSYVLARGGDPDRAHVVSNGVNLQHFHPDVTPSRRWLAAHAFTIGFVGSLKPWHGLEGLLHAFKRCYAARPTSRLLIIGDGPLRGWVEGFAEGAGLQDAIEVIGWVPYAQMPPVLACVDVAVAPYPVLEHFYFSPLKLYEYMAAGRAVVASRVGQICEAIQDGHSGVLCEPDNAADLANQLIALHDDADRRTRLGRGARAAVAGQDWTAKADRILRLAGMEPDA